MPEWDLWVFQTYARTEPTLVLLLKRRLAQLGCPPLSVATLLGNFVPPEAVGASCGGRAPGATPKMDGTRPRGTQAPSLWAGPLLTLLLLPSVPIHTPSVGGPPLARACMPNSLHCTIV